MSFDDFWVECLLLSQNDKQRQIMWRLKNLYYDAWEDGKSPEQAMEDEWG